VRGWKPVVDAVHAKGGKVFVQLMHTGRVSHLANLPAGAYRIAAVTDIGAEELRDPALLEELAAASIAFVLGDGEKKVQDLRIASGG